MSFSRDVGHGPSNRNFTNFVNIYRPLLLHTLWGGHGHAVRHWVETKIVIISEFPMGPICAIYKISEVFRGQPLHKISHGPPRFGDIYLSRNRQLAVTSQSVDNLVANLHAGIGYVFPHCWQSQLRNATDHWKFPGRLKSWRLHLNASDIKCGITLLQMHPHSTTRMRTAGSRAMSNSRKHTYITHL